MAVSVDGRHLCAASIEEADDTQGWIQKFRGGIVRVSFAVWIRDVDESGYFDDLDAVYEQGEQELARFLPEIESSRDGRGRGRAGGSCRTAGSSYRSTAWSRLMMPVRSSTRRAVHAEEAEVGEQVGEHLVAPASRCGLRHAVAAGEVEQASIVTQHREHQPVDPWLKAATVAGSRSHQARPKHVTTP
ncbi:hypothetical protein [Streptomyces sp. NPDC058335]|uniref:hypothetical protein n=1 Tax=Streptomyces sp. NPDC058335 TaxID=3346451 RepID=UPI003662D139